MIRSKDLPGLVLLIGVSVLASFFLSNLLFGSKNLVTQVEEVDAVTAELNYEEKPYFFKGALNPTKDIILNENNSTTPLGQ
jgi:beta-lactam-binding protein with PASTA domain